MLAATVGITGPVERRPRQVKHPLAVPLQHRFQERGRASHHVDAEEGAFRSQRADLRAECLDVLFGGQDLAREHLPALVVQDARPMEGLADIDPDPVTHVPASSKAAITPSPPGTPAVSALPSDLSRLPISGLEIPLGDRGAMRIGAILGRPTVSHPRSSEAPWTLARGVSKR